MSLLSLPPRPGPKRRPSLHTWQQPLCQGCGPQLRDGCRDNVEDALEKLQKAVDSAAKAVIPKAPNAAAKKKIDKQYGHFAVLPMAACRGNLS